MYHAANKNAPILEKGILTGSSKRKNFGMSENGYVYLATTPSIAKMFGEMAHNNNYLIYEIIVPISKLLPDKGRLKFTAPEEIKTRGLAQSLVYAGSARVKGNIELWQIKLLELLEKNTTKGGIFIDQIQSHNNEKSVALSVKAVKLTARLLAKTMRKFLEMSKKGAEKHGEQSLKTLAKSGNALENVEISGDNIASFKKIARKYNIDFALKKDTSIEPPNWVVFFKSKDSKSLDMAFKEFAREQLKNKSPKPSVDEVLKKAKEKAKSDVDPTIKMPTKNLGKGGFEI